MPKRNKTNNRMRNVRTSSNEGASRYAIKVQRKRQMYGPGCCANRLSPYRMGERQP
jgi:hypothetical protein